MQEKCTSIIAFMIQLNLGFESMVFSFEVLDLNN